VSFEIGKDLETGEPVILNVKDIVTGRTYIASETRFGKSHTMRRIAEEILENYVGQVAVILIDPEGEFASLREKYPIIIIGRDIPIQVETPTLLASTAAFMAEKVLEANASAIIDISLVDPEAGKDYVDKFLRRFFHLQTTAKKHYLVIEEEAEDFAPEAGAPGTRTCLEISITLGKRGGKRGIGVIYVGHRPAWINKGILSQCPNKAIGRIEAPDMDALERFARIPRSIVEKLVPKTDEQGKIINPGPERGVFCFTGDWVQKTTFVKVGPVKTTHLGATPEIIPRPIGEVEGVITNVRNALSQLIEKTKPVVASQAEIENKIRTELESKYKGKIEVLERTAVERAERKYRVKIDELEQQLQKVSRSQALQPTAPISDVLEHPIVKTRMLQLDDKARDLLTWIEREPGHTREELAARMVASKDVVSNIVDRINRVFQLQVVVDDGGRPLRYKSVLERLFLTDVAKREIEELDRLQSENAKMKLELEAIRPSAQRSATLQSDVTRITTQYNQAVSRLKEVEASNEHLKESNESLVKENEVYRKIKEGFAALGVVTPTVAPIDEEKVKAIAESKAKEVIESLTVKTSDETRVGVAALQPIDEKKIEEMIEQKVSVRLAEHKVEGAEVIPQKEIIDLEHKELVVDVHHAGEEHVKMDTKTDKGKILYCAKEDLSKDADGKPKESFSWSELKQALTENGWIISDPTVSARLTDLAREGRLIKLEKGGYRLPSKVKFNIEKAES